MTKKAPATLAGAFPSQRAPVGVMLRKGVREHFRLNRRWPCAAFCVSEKQSFRPPSATGSLSLAGPRESNQREWPEDPTLPRAVTSDAIFRQDIRVLSKNGGRPDRRPPGSRSVSLLDCPGRAKSQRSPGRVQRNPGLRSDAAAHFQKRCQGQFLGRKSKNGVRYIYFV